MHTIAQVEDAFAATKTEANQVLDAASQLAKNESDDLYVQFNNVFC